MDRDQPAAQEIQRLLDRGREIHRNDPRQALICVQDAVRLARREGRPLDEAYGLRIAGICLEILTNFPEAENSHRQALTIFTRESDPRGIALVQHSLGVIRTKQGDFPGALRILRESCDYFQSVGDEAELCRVYNSIGIVYKSCSHQDEALHYYLKALEISEKLNLNLSHIMLLNTALIYQALAMLDKALECYERAEKLCLSLSDNYSLTKIYECRSSLSIRMERYDEAKEYCAKALFMAREIGDNNAIAHSLAEIGRLHTELRDYEKALAYLREALGYEMQIHTRYRILLFTGRNLYFMERYDEAQAALEEALAMIEHEEGVERKGDVYQLMSEIYHAKGDLRQELDYFRKSVECERRIAEEKLQRTVIEMQAKFDLRRAEEERDLYRRRSEQLKDEMEKKSHELTAMAMRLIQKNEFLIKIYQHLDELGRGNNTQTIPAIQKEINSAIRSDNEWEVFERQFQLVHQDFLDKLSSKFPGLTQEQQKVCALLKMRLSSKDIANLLCISPRTVESHRYRIRKKLRLPANTDLSMHLAAL